MKKITGKRLLSIVLVLSMLILTLSPLNVFAETSINIGDYLQMGTYYDEPILWRCVDIDENGPLMLSDKIICIKAFDAIGGANTTTGSHSRNSYRQSWGSNYWADSNMRSWLNSAASAGNVNWLCGNPPDKNHVLNGYNAYDKEAGFLTNFTQDELNAVKEVEQKSLLSYPEIDANMATTGTERHALGYDIYDIVTNYDTAYAEYVTDKMFLLDVKQVNAVYKNRNILGENYYIGAPTGKCVANSEYKDEELSAGKKWSYWLRSPSARNYHAVRDIGSSGEVFYGYAYGYVGVRPAFYLNEAVDFTSGSGAGSNPYTFGSAAQDFGPLDITPIVPVLNDADNTISFPITVTDPERAAELNKIELFVAEYDGNGALLGVKLGTKGIINGDTMTVTADIPDGENCKFMLWDGSLAPLMNEITDITAIE